MLSVVKFIENLKFVIKGKSTIWFVLGFLCWYFVLFCLGGGGMRAVLWVCFCFVIDFLGGWVWDVRFFFFYMN